MKRWGLVLSYLRIWQVPFQGPDVGSGGEIQGRPNQKTEEPPIPDAGLKCTSFGWISSWKATSSTPYGGRATEAYLKEHPEEAVHVVISWWERDLLILGRQTSEELVSMLS